MKRATSRSLASIALVCTIVPAWAQVTDLGLPSGAASSTILGLSADGSVAVGYTIDSRWRPYMWTQTSGFVSLSALNGYASGVSADGSVVVGFVEDPASGGAQRAFRWTQASGIVSLGTLNGGVASFANGISADGTVIVGWTYDGLVGPQRAFRWTQAGGMVTLGSLNGGGFSSAAAASEDGSVIVGVAEDGAGPGPFATAFRWTQAGGMVSLGLLNGGAQSVAASVSADGSVVVGYGGDPSAGNQWRAFRWTQATGMVSLGSLNGGLTSLAYGVNADGTVVVGESNDGAAGNVRRAFRWTQATGMQTIETWLRGNGVNVATDNTMIANAVSRDGGVVAGALTSGDAFIARVAPSNNGGGSGGSSGGGIGSGLITLTDVQQSLERNSLGTSMALSAASTMLEGAHSRPLARRVAAGKNVSWLAGDWGGDNHGERSGNLGLAEAGLGRNFGSMQLNASVGRTWAKQDLALSGRAKLDGSYVLAEALAPIAGDVWAVLGGYYLVGDADLRRGYMNAGMPETSAGAPGTRTRGLRARIEWDKALLVAGTGLSPYADLTRNRSKVDSYTESGGGFPAQFDTRNDKATEFRFGMNATKPISRDMRLLGTVEAAHRFEKTGSPVSGSLVGLFAFDVPGAVNQRNWLRLAGGIEGKLGDGIASLTLNLTTKGDAPSYWIAASWQLAF